ncbi:MAG: hypothetical protein NTU49_10140 [Gammaproteobacteria bacterium]|nr:hypothetical protein [Gammaproteobacteria bacterium]
MKKVTLIMAGLMCAGAAWGATYVCPSLSQYTSAGAGTWTGLDGKYMAMCSTNSKIVSCRNNFSGLGTSVITCSD